MPKISIEQSTYERLGRHAVAFSDPPDTPDTVINRVLDMAESQGVQNELRGTRNGSEPEAGGLRHLIDSKKLPDLRHTKVLDASLAGNRIVNPNWNGLLESVLALAMDRLGSFEKLRQICPTNMVRGHKSDEGYKHLVDLGLSLQGKSANDACKALLAVVQNLSIRVEITFMWRPRKGAAYPGERGQIRLPAA